MLLYLFCILSLTYSSVRTHKDRQIHSKLDIQHESLKNDLLTNAHKFISEKDKSCTSTIKHPHRVRATIRRKRHVQAVTPNKDKFGKAAYFSGTEESLVFKTEENGINIPNGEFTAEFWMKPEGGQADPVRILGKMKQHFKHPNKT